MIQHLRVLGFLFIILTGTANIVLGQERTITGVVTDASDNLPLPFVNILVKGTSVGTVTDLDGHYSITVTGNEDILVFSYIGYLEQEIPVQQQNIIDLQMTEDVLSLEEVVVIGYGQVQKSDITGSISSISSEEMLERPVTRIDQALQGRAAGVQIASTSGMPGSGTSIRIRGHGSLGTSNAPLWVIDGYVGADINTVAPEDIQSIEILKDASSTAIYGARGGNGVIIVTTRHGDANQNRLNFAHYTEMRSVIKTMDMLNAPEFMKLRNEALANDGFDPQYSEGEINLSEPIRSTGYIADTDWQDELFRNALAHYYHLGMSGGSEKTRYAISANYKTEDGIIHYSEYEKAGINLNLIHEISDKVNFGTNIKGYLSEQQGFEVATGSSWAYGPAGNAVVSLPIYPVYDSLGGYYTNNIWDNPLYAAKEDVDIRNNAAVQGNFYVNYSPIKYLNLNANISGEFRTSMRKRFVTAGLNEATLTQNLAKGLIAQGNYTKWIGNLVATYDREFNNVHHVVAMIGVEQQVIRSNSHIMNGTDINKETLLWYDFNAFNPDYHQPYSDWWGSVYQSQFSRLSYNLKNRYLLQATVRRDGSSKFGSSKKFGIFPSFSLAWKIHHEEFISNLGVFDQLKVRLSWGQSGNDQIALYQWLPEISYTYPHNLAVFGDNVVHSAIINKIPNNNIGWEASTTINAGLDLSFLKNRLNITVDLYDRTTTDLLWDDLLPLYTGYGDGWSTNSVKITTNLAEMNNKGIELAIGVIAVNNNDWNVEVNMNISTNKNNVVYMGGQNEFYVGATKVEVGQPIGNIWGYKTNGLYSVQDSIAGVIPTGSRPGDQKYVDTNGDSIINDDDRTVIGNALPDFTAGLNASISYKGWQVSMTFNSFFGNDMYNGTYETIAKGDLGRTNGGTFLMNAWNVGNQESDIPRLSTNYQSKTSDRFVEDASFLKMTNFMISYNLPGSFLSKIKVQDMKLYVSGQNLLVLSKYSGFDPEQHSGGDSNLNLGSDNKNYPSFRAFTAGISLTF